MVGAYLAPGGLGGEGALDPVGGIIALPETTLLGDSSLAGCTSEVLTILKTIRLYLGDFSAACF